jgi:hypothetical protein
MTRILIGALSGWAYADRRERCLSTWMADGDALGVQSVFLLGCPTAAAPELIGPYALALPCPDDYPSLPQRTAWFCRWALNLPSPSAVLSGGRGAGGEGALLPSPSGRGAGGEGWDYLFKCDDDTYVSIPRLKAYDLAGRDYVGAEWKPGVGYASGGAGYFLSRRAATIVAETLAITHWAEDLHVGNALRAAGIPLSIEPRLVPFASMERRPRRDNDLLTLHACTAVWHATHAETGLYAASGHPSPCYAGNTEI